MQDFVSLFSQSFSTLNEVFYTLQIHLCHFQCKTGFINRASVWKCEPCVLLSVSKGIILVGDTGNLLCRFSQSSGIEFPPLDNMK